MLEYLKMKLKNSKSARKRVIPTGSGKLTHRKLAAQHLSAGKSKRVRSNADKTEAFSKVDVKNIKKLVPYL